MIELMAFRMLLDMAAQESQEGGHRNRNNAVQISSNKSFADVSEQILKCYHPTAQFRSVDVVETPWSRQAQFNADRSILIRIEFFGVSRARYNMVVGLLGKDKNIKTVVQDDSAMFGPKSKCALNTWTNVVP